MINHNKNNKYVGYWLLLGAAMIAVQVILGGITRLTGSGLSITEWNALMGWMPPLNETDWQQLFNKYKATSQFQLINSNMDLSGFKHIFFWEYFHRLWARGIGAVFMIAFVFFIYKKWLSKKLIPHLATLFLLGGLQGFIGWAMVSTGLKDRAWVTPFSLTLHLLLATLTFSYLIWIYTTSFQQKNSLVIAPQKIKLLNCIILFVLLQMMFGGLMAGSHAALHYPTFPTMNGKYFPENIYNNQISLFENFIQNVTFIQFFHRNLAYFITMFILIFWWKNKNEISLESFQWLPYMITIQVLLGVITVVLSKVKIPVSFGVAHQFGALTLLTLLLLTRFRLKKST